VIQLTGASRRRQYLLGPRRAPLVSGWRTVAIGPDLLLEAHPDLQVTQAMTGDRRLTLLGFIVDPTAPGRSDIEILEGLADDVRIDAPAVGTARFGGRWVLIVEAGGHTVLLADPAGLRQTYHAVSGAGAVWAASQSAFLAQVLDLPVDPEAAEFAGSVYFRSYPEPWWPADATLHQGSQRLLPNHLLDLRTGLVRRFWPDAPKGRLSVDEAADRCATLLRGSMNAAAARGPLVLGLTAGIDSRSLLAASRDVQAGLLCCTIDNGVSGGNRRDVTTARRVLDRLGLPHLVVPRASSIDPSFLRDYQASVDCPHAYCAHHTFGLLRDLPTDRLWVSGNCSEIGRGYLRSQMPGIVTTPRSLAAAANMERSPWAVRSIGRWLDTAAPAAERYGYDPVDLFHWEHIMGSWLANAQSERDIVTDWFTPFGDRLLIETMLAVDLADRMPPAHRLHRAMLSILWPETLAEPFNPVDPIGRLRLVARSGAVGLLSRTHLLGPIKTAFLKARSRRIERL